MKLRNLIIMMLDEMASCRYECVWICTEDDPTPLHVIWGLDKDYKEKAMEYLKVFGQREVVMVIGYTEENDYITYEGYRVIVRK